MASGDSGGFAPSQEAIDPATGAKYRKCAAAAVIDSSGRMLIGERIQIPGAWNAPQGGMDAENSESAAAAAAREAFEEVGITSTGEQAQVVLVASQESNEDAVRYEAGGWLTKAGFAGQQLHWALFYTSDAKLDAEPSRICELGGLGGGAPEFSQVKWAPIDEVIESMWEAKRKPYVSLRDWARPFIGQRVAACTAIDFSGTWTRDSAASSGVIAGLLARGQSAEEAGKKADLPYVQLWERSSEKTLEWFVTTFGSDGVTPRRKLLYLVGEWDEEWGHEGVPSGHTRPSTLFGAAEGVVHRRTVYLAEQQADQGWAHSTLSPTPIGEEEARRYMKDGKMMLRRTFWPNCAPAETVVPVVSTEVFTRRE